MGDWRLGDWEIGKLEIDVNSIIVTIGVIVTILGSLSGLAVGHYYSRKASGKKNLTRAEFNRGIILFTTTFFISTAGMGCAMLIQGFLEPEPVSVTTVIAISFLCLGLPPLFAAGVFISSFKRSVEKED